MNTFDATPTNQKKSIDVVSITISVIVTLLIVGGVYFINQRFAPSPMSTDTVTQVSTVSISSVSSSVSSLSSRASSSVAPLPPAVVVVLNGTTTAGLAKKNQDALAGVAGITLGTVANASRANYTTTQVFDVSGKYAVKAAEIATLLGGSVVTTFAGETTEGIDIVVIVAK